MRTAKIPSPLADLLENPSFGAWQGAAPVDCDLQGTQALINELIRRRFHHAPVQGLQLNDLFPSDSEAFNALSATFKMSYVLPRDFSRNEYLALSIPKPSKESKGLSRVSAGSLVSVQGQQYFSADGSDWTLRLDGLLSFSRDKVKPSWVFWTDARACQVSRVALNRSAH